MCGAWPAAWPRWSTGAAPSRSRKPSSGCSYGAPQVAPQPCRSGEVPAAGRKITRTHLVCAILCLFSPCARSLVLFSMSRFRDCLFRAACIVIAKTFLLRCFHIAGAFLLYALECAFSVLFVAYFVPETRGRTLEEIEASFKTL
jgi:hypothetical protein